MWVTLALLAALGCPAQETPVGTPAAPAQETKSSGLPLSGAAAEAFLRDAKVVENKPNPVGITQSRRVKLSDGETTLRAKWQTIDVFKPGVTQFAEGGSEVDFRDCYKFEVAAYELDKLLGLDLVPPTVERAIDGEKGALQLWVEGAMTEADRKDKGLKVPDPEAWNAQIFKVRLIHQLTYDTDYNNVKNILVDPEFRVYVIDLTRAFRKFGELLAEKDLTRFSRSVLERLGTLDKPLLEQKLGRWLGRYEIEGLLKRRDKILAVAKKRVAEKGEDAVLYP